MSRRVNIVVSVKLTMDVEDGMAVEDVVNELEYDFKVDSEYGTIIDTEMTEYRAGVSR